LLRFLRCVSRLHLKEDDIYRVTAFLSKSIPWGELVERAEEEGVSGLLLHHLRHPKVVNPPPENILGHLKAIDLQTTRTTLAMVAELKRLSEWMILAGIQAIVLQGMSLIKLYRDPGLRPLSDIDLMVRPIHKPKFKKMLLEAGYCNVAEVYPDIFYRDGICIDIHSHILNLDRIESRRYLFAQDMEPMWERAIPYFGWTKNLMVLDPFDNFIALAAHALKHSYASLIWLVDLRELLIRLTGRPDGWEKIVERTYFWKQQKVILYTLLLMEGMLHHDNIPGWVYSDLGILQLSLAERYLIRLKIRGFSSERYCNALWLFIIPGVRYKLKFIHEALFPRDEIMTQIFLDNRGKGRKRSIIKRIFQTGGLLWDDVRKACNLPS